MTKISLLIFDFDGTIVDSKTLYYTYINKHLKKLDFAKKEIDKAIDLGWSLYETLRKLGLKEIRAKKFKKKIMDDVLAGVRKVKKCKNVEVLKDLKEDKIIISNSLREFIVPILEHLGIKKHFSEVYGAEDFEMKEQFIKDYLKKNKIKSNECLYIGDRVADVKVANDSGCLSVVVAGKCSWDSRKKLLRAKPDFIVSDLGGLKDLLG